MPSAVMIGAGKIGRGFIGRLMSKSGYHVVFADTDDQLVERLKGVSSYPLRIVAPDREYDELVRDFSAVSMHDERSVSQALAAAEFCAVSVGAGNLRDVAPVLSRGVRLRLAMGGSPLTVFVCENLVGADEVLKTAVLAAFTEEERSRCAARLRIVATTIGATVPLPPPKLTRNDPLALLVSAYDELPYDEEALPIAAPRLYGLKPYRPFSYSIHRKIFVHNLGHAVAAYVGQLRGHALLTDATADPAVRAIMAEAMHESARALKKAYPFAEGLDGYIEELLALFDNEAMGDTLARLGQGAMRKLAAGDRLCGAYNFCLQHGLEAPCIATGIAAALHYMPQREADLEERLQDGIGAFLQEHGKLSPAGISGVSCAYAALTLAGGV